MCLGMVELRLLSPTGGGMTFRTFLAELTVVGIILLMAGETSGRGLAVRAMLLVAICTVYELMSSLERKIRLIVPERRGIQTGDIRIAPLVFGMAIRTLPRLDTGNPAVKPLPGLDVLVDLLVAIQA